MKRFQGGEGSALVEENWNKVKGDRDKFAGGCLVGALGDREEWACRVNSIHDSF